MKHKYLQTKRLYLNEKEGGELNKNLEDYFNNIPKSLSINTKVFSDKKYSSTYGELTMNGYNKLKHHFPNTKNNKFIDLGSGYGKVSIMVGQETNFNLADGVELSNERYNVAQNLKNKVMKNSNKINFHNKDLFDLDLNKYNVIYTSNLCFNKDTNKKLANKLSKELINGSYIFASKQLNDPSLQFQKKIEVEMTWNKNHVLNMYIKQS